MVENGYASIYTSEIHKYTDDNRLDASTLMTYARVHEIGHLLLGRGHSSLEIVQTI